jgi:hypothetical protein
MQIGTKVYLWDPSSNRIVVTTMICSLYNNKIGAKVIFIDYMVVQVGDVFMK